MTAPRTVAASPLNQNALQRLMRILKSSRTSCAAIYRGNRRVIGFDNNPGQLIQTMSITKSISALALGLLFADRVPQVLNWPLSRWFVGHKWRNVSLRQLVTHTTGLVAPPPKSIYRARDFVKLALSTRLQHRPGTRFRYNNLAVNLLAGIVKKQSGEALDRLLQRRLFAPLGIRRFRWSKDRAGNPHVLAGLRLSCNGLARIGHLLLNRGLQGKRQLLHRNFVELLKRPGSSLSREVSLLWWLTRTGRGENVLYTWGSGGQFLVIIPKQRLLVIRLGVKGARLPRRRFLRAVIALTR